MLELDDATRRALRGHYGPPPTAEARMLDQLRRRLVPAGPDEPGEDTSDADSGSRDLGDDPKDVGDADLGAGECLDGAGLDSSPVGGPPLGLEQLAWVGKIVAATAGLSAAGLVVVTLGVAALTGPAETQLPATGAEPPTDMAFIDSGARGPSPTPADAGSRGPAVDRPRSEAADSPGAVAPGKASPSARAPTSVDARPSHAQSEAGSEAGLGAELAMLEAAEVLRSGAPEAALAKLELHRAKFPRGILAPEREVLRVELLCTLGRRTQAARVAAAFVTTHEAPQLRARVEASCVGTDSQPAGHGSR